MNISKFYLISCFSVLIPFATSIIYLKKIKKEYNPFLAFLFLIAVSDLSFAFLDVFSLYYTTLFKIIFHTNPLIEALIITWLFKKWGVFKKRLILFKILLTFYFVLWVVIKIYYGALSRPIAYFTFLGQFISTILNIALINRLAGNKEHLYFNPKFICCCGFIFYNLVGIVPTIFSMYFLETSPSFRKSLLTIPHAGVTISYLVFTYAIILMVKEKREMQLQQF